MYRQAATAPCNLNLAGNYLRENGLPPLPLARRDESLIAPELMPPDCSSCTTAQHGNKSMPCYLSVFTLMLPE
ncbi:unnamed protein product, partial [Brenthis ino]